MSEKQLVVSYKRPMHAARVDVPVVEVVEKDGEVVGYKVHEKPNDFQVTVVPVQFVREVK